MKNSPGRSLMCVSAVVLLLTLVGAAAVATAAPYRGDEVTIRQPDGSLIVLLVWGDEFYAVGETRDGYTVVRDPDTRMFCYARLSADGSELVSTGIPANEAPPLRGLAQHVRISQADAVERARSAREAFEARQIDAAVGASGRAGRGPTTGSVVGITLIIDFSDEVATIPASSIDDYCNKIGYTGFGNNGSVREYFLDVSEDMLDYSNYVPTQYYRATQTKEYYSDPAVPYGQRATELIIEALSYMDSNGFDFSQYDADGNGVIDAVNCFYAGYTWNNWAEGLWPHSGWVGFGADGVSTQRYQITDLGSQLRLGTFCHENGHMLMGWPDLYDYDYDSTGVGSYCLMCYSPSGTNPVEPCAYMKVSAGWADVTELGAPAVGYEVPSGGNVIYRFDHPDRPNEYYLVENRQRTGRDASLPDDGLAIWHVDTHGSNNYQQQTPEYHYLVTLVQADGRWDLENNRNYGDGTDLYASPRYPACTPATYPNTNWWDGGESGAYFTGISESGTAMTFDFYNSMYKLELATVVHASEIGFAGTATYTATVKNWSTIPDTATVSISQTVLPDGVTEDDWMASFREPGGSWQATPLVIPMAAGETRDVEVRMVDGVGTTAGMALTTLSVTGSREGVPGADLSFATFVELPSILIVDDDNGGDLETHLETALADTGYAAQTWDAGARGRPTLDNLSSYWAVLWTTGSGAALYLTADDEQNIMSYLDAGGNLYLTSAEYLGSRSLPNAFIEDYLHLTAWACDNSGFVMSGVDGDPISDGMSLIVLGGPIPPACSDALYPTAPAETLFTTPVGVKGLTVEENGHKLAFTSFPFENVRKDDPYPDNQKTLIARILDWFGAETGIESDMIHSLALRQNAPNPFNPTTTIAFTVPDGADRVELTIYNVAGQAVRRLVDGVLESGPGKEVWDGTDDAGRSLASGVYFARLSVDNEAVVRKMTLLK
ncbi:MAG: M6 family metalloprotease domain-containing protein [Candidatus Eisenbacteria bacterium]|nr:M6 family metalloprotease domain-containing protein [Candidatus Eisenbacteria bacterium]